MESLRAYSSGTLLSVLQRDAFEDTPAECFRASSSGMLSSVFKWTAFEHIPAECFRAHSSGMLSNVFQLLQTKPKTPSHIDGVVSAEIPDPKEHPELHSFVDIHT